MHARCPSSKAMALAVITALTAGATLVASAHEGATGVVAERMEAMESLGDAMKGLAAMYRGRAPYDAAAVRDAAEAIGRHGGERMTALFPPGSLHHPSEAQPEIWEDWERFGELAEDLRVTAAALAAAAGPDAAASEASAQSRAAFARLGRVCSACHTDFRKED